MKALALDPQPSTAASRKLFYRIQEVAKMTGLKPYVLRYWESEFKELAPEKDASDQRRYRPSDIEVIQAIRKLLYEDRYTIQGARKRLRYELQKMRGPEQVEMVEITETFELITPVRETSERPRRGVDNTLHRLRTEVNELIAMLSH